MNEQSNNQNHGETFFSWEFPEYIKYKRTKWWYLGMGLFGGLLMIYAIVAKNFLFALIIVMVGIIIFLYEAKEPLTVKFKITEDGLELGDNFFLWKEIKNFWVIYEPPTIKNLYVDFKNIFRPRISVPLEGQDPIKIRERLLEYIDEDTEKEEEPVSDSIGRMFKL